MYLYEYTVKELLDMAKRDTERRFEKRLQYTIDDYGGIDFGELERGHLQIYFLVKGTQDYRITVKFENFVPLLKSDRFIYRRDVQMKGISYSHVIKICLQEVVDTFDVKVACECPDFHYRFAYIATQQNIKVTEPEHRPPDITNPERVGYVCKHLFMILSKPSKWIPRISPMIKKATLGLGIVDRDDVYTRE